MYGLHGDAQRADDVYAVRPHLLPQVPEDRGGRRRRLSAGRVPRVQRPRCKARDADDGRLHTMFHRLRTASPDFRPVVLYVKRTRMTWMGPPGAFANHCANSCSVATNGRPRRRTNEDVGCAMLHTLSTSDTQKPATTARDHKARPGDHPSSRPPRADVPTVAWEARKKAKGQDFFP